MTTTVVGSKDNRLTLKQNLTNTNQNLSLGMNLENILVNGKMIFINNIAIGNITIALLGTVPDILILDKSLVLYIVLFKFFQKFWIKYIRSAAFGISAASEKPGELDSYD
nr:3096_t:CDS:2 [Entrophospora candida]